eukprot:10607365-Lingulodinium_polyedra.AAC.1
MTSHANRSVAVIDEALHSAPPRHFPLSGLERRAIAGSLHCWHLQLAGHNPPECQKEVVQDRAGQARVGDRGHDVGVLPERYRRPVRRVIHRR